MTETTNLIAINKINQFISRRNLYLYKKKYVYIYESRKRSYAGLNKSVHLFTHNQYNKQNKKQKNLD